MIKKRKPVHPSIAIVLTTVFALSAMTPPAHALPEVQVLSSDDVIAAPRWMFGQGTPPKAGSDVVSQLAQVKWAEVSGDRAKCVQLARAIQPKAKSLAGWLSLVALDCASGHSVSLAQVQSTAPPAITTANADIIEKILESIDKNPQWLLKGAQAAGLRQSMIRASLIALEQDIKTNRSRAWKSIERLEELSGTMDNRSRAKMWKFAGQLSFIQQKGEAARDFFRRSLTDYDDEETRQHLKATEASLVASTQKEDTKATPTPKPATPTPRPASVSLEASKEELQLADRITTSLKAGDFLPAVEDAMRMITSYPGSSRSHWATDRVLEAYVSIGDRTDPKYQLLREQFIKIMGRADAERLGEWARVLYNKGFFQESFELSEKALVTMTGAHRTKVLDLALDGAVATEHFDMAKVNAQDLIDHHAGTPQAKDALLRLGMFHYREGQFVLAVADLERLLAIPQIDNLELPARYWLWRALQKSKSERADDAANEVMQRFPFSYYGLRARFERNSHVLDWPTPKNPKKIESRMWLTGPERVAWEKAQLLLKAGWLDEAQAEFRELPPPSKSDDRAIRALYFAAAGGFVTASQMASTAWDDNPELRRTPFTDASYPHEFGTYIAKNADDRKLDRDLVRSLIRQESSYNVKAQSPSPAFGLMQIIAPTAKEIASDLHLPAPNIPEDMFKPNVNITMGTYYLSKMINKYQGNIPLGLAAYNAGPMRIDRWLRTRPLLSEALKTASAPKNSPAEDEMWFDEIPYAETSFYVKAILRNLLLYKMLEQGRVEIPEPVWVIHESRAQ